MQDIISRLRAKKGDEGFTLIELLVVVVIIGVLVAIAVPVYLNYREGAANKAAQSDVRGAISALEQYYTDNANAYPSGSATNSTNPGTNITLPGTVPSVITTSAGTTLTYENKSTYYVVCAKNSGGDNVYVYNSQTGGSVKQSSQTSVAACITNGN